MGESKLDHVLSMISESFGLMLKWLLIVGGIVVAIEQIMMRASLNKLVIATLIALVVGVVAIELLVRKKFLK